MQFPGTKTLARKYEFRELGNTKVIYFRTLDSDSDSKPISVDSDWSHDFWNHDSLSQAILNIFFFIIGHFKGLETGINSDTSSDDS